jgi:hypothetical protein
MESCPLCQAQFDVHLTFNPSQHTYDLAIHSSEKVEEHIRQSLIGYWRWKAEGQPKDSFYYDAYHNSIEYDAEHKRYRFDIQICDSPEGDMWIFGSFQLRSLLHIEDIHYRSEIR